VTPLPVYVDTLTEVFNVSESAAGVKPWLKKNPPTEIFLLPI
jgi:hypothetical protein